MITFGTLYLQTAEPIFKAFKAGYRFIDTSETYANETTIKEALKQAKDELGIERSDIDITTKIAIEFGAKSDSVTYTFLTHLKKMGLDYVDRCLLYSPEVPGYGSMDKVREAAQIRKETWQAMESLLRKDKIKQLGVSNYRIGHLQELLLYAQVRPVVNQLEIHPYLPQTELVNWCSDHKIEVQSYESLKFLGILNDPTIKAIAWLYSKRYGETINSANIIHDWLRTRGIDIITSTTNPDHLAEHLESALVGRSLENTDMKLIEKLDHKVGSENRYWDYNDVPSLCDVHYYGLKGSKKRSKKRSNKRTKRSSDDNIDEPRRSKRRKVSGISQRGISLFYSKPWTIRGKMKMRAVHKNPNIYVIDNFLSQKEIDHLCGIIDYANWNRSYNPNGDPISSFAIVPSITTVSEIESRVCELVDVFPYNIEQLQMVKYKKGELNNTHHDAGVIYEDGSIELILPVRLYTIFVYLSTLKNSDGGCTYFPELGFRIRPQRGGAILFPNVNSDRSVKAQVIHREEPIKTNVTNYGMNIWITNVRMMK